MPITYQFQKNHLQKNIIIIKKIGFQDFPTNEDNTNIQGKFKEADTKLELFYRTHKKTTASTELIQMLQEGRYPGLGVVKKLSIKNHLELIEDILSKSI